MTRLEQLRQLITGEREFPPSGKLLGLRMVGVEEGSATIEMPIRDELLNRGGGVQGGFLAALLDSAMGSSIGSLCEEDETHATLEFKLNFLRSALVGESPLTAVGHVLWRGSRIAHVEGEIRGSKGDLLVKATSSWVIQKISTGTPPPERD